MTTYRGGEIPKPDQLDADLKTVGARLGGMENVEEELNLPPEAGSDMLRRPGMKGYMDTKPGGYKTGGVVQTQDPMPPDQRKLADRININEIMQMQDDAKYLGRGTSSELMPPPPTTDSFAGGGMVKHGSSTVVSCKTKHGG